MQGGGFEKIVNTKKKHQYDEYEHRMSKKEVKKLEKQRHQARREKRDTFEDEDN